MSQSRHRSLREKTFLSKDYGNRKIPGIIYGRVDINARFSGIEPVTRMFEILFYYKNLLERNSLLLAGKPDEET